MRRRIAGDMVCGARHELEIGRPSVKHVTMAVRLVLGVAVIVTAAGCGEDEPSQAGLAQTAPAAKPAAKYATPKGVLDALFAAAGEGQFDTMVACLAHPAAVGCKATWLTG